MGHATEGKRGDKTQSLLVSITDSYEGNDSLIKMGKKKKNINH